MDFCRKLIEEPLQGESRVAVCRCVHSALSIFCLLCFPIHLFIEPLKVTIHKLVIKWAFNFSVHLISVSVCLHANVIIKNYKHIFFVFFASESLNLWLSNNAEPICNKMPSQWCRVVDAKTIQRKYKLLDWVLIKHQAQFTDLIPNALITSQIIRAQKKRTSM